MSDIDLLALEANFQTWKQDRAANLSSSRAFERFVVDQVLKNLDPSDEEIDSGDLGGSDDGGVDAMHIVMNRTLLITEETDVPQPTTSVELIVVQAKLESGFAETAVQKLQAFCSDMLDYSKEPDEFTYLNPAAREAVGRFRSKYGEVLAHPHTITVTFHYATKAAVMPRGADKVVRRVEMLKEFIKSKLSLAKVEFEWWGCSRLLAAARELPKQEHVLTITKSLSDDDGSVVCLSKLQDFAAFLTDEGGQLRADMLEPNVRDYQGRRNPVNTDIRETLKGPDSEEFWWLNNGITILVTRASVIGNKLTMTAPEIVNGLQTSNEIFSVFSSGGLQNDQRNVLIRAIVSSDDRSRDRVIKATNFQTPVEALSLRATDRIHFDIEDRLKLHGLYYDRKKGKYKRLRKPIADIIAMKTLAQAVMAVALQQPDDARARPKNLLRDESSYGRLFDESYNRDLYVSCILIDRRVSAHLNNVDLSREDKRDIRYCVDTLVACKLAGTLSPSIEQLAALAPHCRRASVSLVQDAVEVVHRAYTSLGGTDKVAKNDTLWKRVRERGLEANG